jgi:hypothetical protein
LIQPIESRPKLTLILTFEPLNHRTSLARNRLTSGAYCVVGATWDIIQQLWRPGMITPEPNPAHLKAVISAINTGPFFKHLSIRVTEIGVGYSVVVMKIGKKHMNPFGGLHGGVYASAIDTAAYWSAYCDLPEQNGLVSIY